MGREIPESSQAPITLLLIEIHELDKTGVCSLKPQDLSSAWEKIHHYHENTKSLVGHCKKLRARMWTTSQRCESQSADSGTDSCESRYFSDSAHEKKISDTFK